MRVLAAELYLVGMSIGVRYGGTDPTSARRPSAAP